jgi:hypothetical protein
MQENLRTPVGGSSNDTPRDFLLPMFLTSARTHVSLGRCARVPFSSLLARPPPASCASRASPSHGAPGRVARPVPSSLAQDGARSCPLLQLLPASASSSLRVVKSLCIAVPSSLYSHGARIFIGHGASSSPRPSVLLTGAASPAGAHSARRALPRPLLDRAFSQRRVPLLLSLLRALERAVLCLPRPHARSMARSRVLELGFELTQPLLCFFHGRVSFSLVTAQVS